ncbi:MAG: hypothetical protein ACRCSL_16700 [Microbacterium sp.]
MLYDGDADVYDLSDGRLWPWEREVRLLRARVAIALRAALRADEDARCEEVQRDHDRRVARVPDAVWRSGADVAAWAVVKRFREWPALYRGRSLTVPLALWEVVR